MITRIALLCMLMIHLQGCSQSANVDYTYPKNRPELDEQRVGSMAGPDGFYLTKSN